MKVMMWHLLVTTLITLLLISCGPQTYSLELYLTLYDETGSNIEFDELRCNGRLSYEDISRGQQIRVLDGSDNVIGVSKWSSGIPSANEQLFETLKGKAESEAEGDFDAAYHYYVMLKISFQLETISNDECTLFAKIEVPKADIYQIEGRGNHTVTFDELKETDWNLYLSLGED